MIRQSNLNGQMGGDKRQTNQGSEERLAFIDMMDHRGTG